MKNQYNGLDGNGYQPVLSEPPPMRIGEEGNTIDRVGVRRKADGTLRNFTREALRKLMLIIGMLVCVSSVVFFYTGASDLAWCLLAGSWVNLQIVKRWLPKR